MRPISLSIPHSRTKDSLIPYGLDEHEICFALLVEFVVLIGFFCCCWRHPTSEINFLYIPEGLLKWMDGRDYIQTRKHL